LLSLLLRRLEVAPQKPDAFLWTAGEARKDPVVGCGRAGLCRVPLDRIGGRLGLDTEGHRVSPAEVDEHLVSGRHTGRPRDAAAE
jgi:hypothetical protein